MRFTKVALACTSSLALLAPLSCESDGDDSANVAGSGGKGSAGADGSAAGTLNGGGTGNVAGAAAGSSASSQAGDAQGGRAADPGGGGLGGVGGEAPVPEGCGDPKREGVLIYQDIDAETTWSCPVYTLTQPIYVHSASDEPVVLHIAPGVVIRGVKGVEPTKLPGALIITRSARIDAVGDAQHPIRFTTAEAPGDAVPGSWGGLMLLGRAAVNAPANFETSGKPAGELYAEALPKNELGLYGWPRPAPDGGGGAGAGGAPSVDAGGAGGSDLEDPHATWDCGKLQYVRIDFAGFRAGATKELNGLTLGGCGSDTSIDHVQVHRSSDDGIEIFGGSVNLSHVVLTGNQDDSLDWDQGWRGKAQFVAIQSHDDADGLDSCGIEADGFATPEAPFGEPSAPRIFNLTLIASKNTQRGIRFRDGTQALLENALLIAHAQGVPQGLIDIDHVRTADNLAAGTLLVHHSVLRGTWPASGQADTLGTLRNEQDFFTGNGEGALGNEVIGSASELWLNAFNTSQPEWVPAADSVADEGAVAPSDGDGSSFFDSSATYRGAFEPGGNDWTAGWTSYP